MRTECLEKSPKTAKDLECPHGVQFYDVVIGGERHPRNAWVYEAPQPSSRRSVADVSASGRTSSSALTSAIFAKSFRSPAPIFRDMTG